MGRPGFLGRLLAALRRRWPRRWRPLGSRGECAAEQHLRRLGFQVLARNARGDLGEIDLVAWDGHTVVFVEVKTRQRGEPDEAAQAVDAAKQRRLTRLALAWLKRRGLLEYPARFDVLAVTWPPGGSRPAIEHYRNAFEATGLPGMYS